MWEYQKKLQIPINIKNPDPKLAAFIVSQYGGAYCKCLSSAPLNPSTKQNLVPLPLGKGGESGAVSEAD